MAGRSRGRNTSGRFYNANQRNEHDDRASRPSTSRGGGGYADRHGFNKKVTFKANNRGGNQFRKSWDSKTDLVREQLDGEFSTRNGPPRNNYSRRSFPERHNNRGGGHTNYRNPSWTLKESSTGWYSVYVPNVEDSEEVMKIIETYITPNVFYAYNKQYFDSALRFLVDDCKIAKTLHNTSYKITLRDDRRLVIKVNPYFPPRNAITFTPVFAEVKEKMIEAMSTRYNPSTKSLDLSRFYACPLFTESQLFVSLNRPSVLLAALKMVAEHTKHDLYGLSLENNHIYLGEGLVWIRRLFPELKVLDLGGNKLADLKELRSLSGFSIEVLNLSRNPVNDTEDKERYRRNIQELFPLLSKLDNADLPSRYNAIVDSKLKMPINQGNCWPIPEGHNPEEPNPVIQLVESFLTQYYERYDNKLSRQMVAEAYHEDAMFSLSSCFLVNPTKGGLTQYLPESRNFMKINNKNVRNRLVHKTRDNIINFLEKLPKTKHDLGSFQVDVPLANAAMIQITVNGVFAEDFKEGSNNYRPMFRSFCRTFCIVPVGGGWSILSDMLFVTVVTDELLVESAKRFFVPIKSRPVSSKNNNTNSNSNSNNSNMFMEDSEEMCGMESSSSYQQQPALPNYPPPSYQQATTFTAPAIPQQPPTYQVGMQTSNMQNQSTSFPQQSQTVQFASNPQNLNQSFSMFNSTPAEPATFPVNPISSPVNQLPTAVPSNSVGDANANSDNKLTLIKAFSNESGMNETWAEKCLVENNWNYAEAALCFSQLKDNIPQDAFTR